MFCTLVSCLSEGKMAIIEVISATKSPAVRRPAMASCPAISSSTANPTEPSSCTAADEIARVDSTFIASLRLVSANAP
jgi:hypothetical protein